ncbi:MAG: hypothetical protein ACR2LR_18650 [Hassallia sp.]
MLQSIEGIYKHGKVELAELPSNVSESQVIVTFLESKKAQIERQIMRFGMFSGNKQSTEEDFEIAEFKGDTEDGLEWS